MGSDLNSSSIVKMYSEFVSKFKTEFFIQNKLDFVQKDRNGIYLTIEKVVKNNKLSIQMIDCRTSGGVFNLGHNHPEIIKTLQKGIETGLDIGDHHLISKERALLASRMAKLLPGNVSKTQFCVSGGEAVDLAIKLARAHTKRKKVISASVGYHGVTGLALGATSTDFGRPFFHDQQDFLKVKFGDIEDFKRVANEEVACVILETIPATGGILIAPEGYFSNIREICNEKGIVMIADEVQTGLGRTGKLWGIYGGLHKEEKIVPDIMVLGKGMSAGIYPMSTVSYKPELEEVFSIDPFLHISTTGGSELGCVITNKMLDIVSEPTFLSNVIRQGELFQEYLEQFAKESGVVKEIRGRGLMWGIEFADKRLSLAFTVLMIQNGIFADYCGNFKETIKLMPPLIVNDLDVKEIMLRLNNAFLGLKKSL
jgi:acetylornithine/succinyldiaminopimelate/putrescine aminotransferase